MGTVMRLLCLREVTVAMRKASGRGPRDGSSEGDTGGGWPYGSLPCDGGVIRGWFLGRRKWSSGSGVRLGVGDGLG